MSDDVDLLRRYAASVPPPTADLFESTRSRLVEAIETEVGTAETGTPASDPPLGRAGAPVPRRRCGGHPAPRPRATARCLDWGGSRASEAPVGGSPAT